ncbi:MAG TPA: hypothetical protein VF244_01735 [Acidimicrobiales bacterium]
MPPSSPRRLAATALAALAILALLALFAVLIGAGPVAGPGRAPAETRAPEAGLDTGWTLSDGHQLLEVARRVRPVPAPVAVLTAVVVVAGWTLGRRFVSPPRGPVRSWTGFRAWVSRGPPLMAV